VAMRLGGFFFLTYVVWELVQIAGLALSTATYGLAARSLTQSTMLVVLLVVHQAASLAGGSIQPEWVTGAMWFAFLGEFGQWAGTLLLPLLFNSELAMTDKGDVDLLLQAPKAMGYIRFLRWICIAMVYMAVYYLMKDLANLPSSPICSVGGIDAYWLIFTLIAIYYIGYFVAWLVRAATEIRTVETPVFGSGGAFGWGALFAFAVLMFLVVDVLAMNGADKEALIVGATGVVFAVAFTYVDHGVFESRGEDTMNMSSFAHIYICGRYFEWIPTITCVILAYFLVNYH